MHDAKGADRMSDAWVEFVVGPSVVVLVGVVAEGLRRLLKRIDLVLHQVKNDHPSNLREDIDEVKDAQVTINTAIAGLVQELRAHLTVADGERVILNKLVVDVDALKG